MLRRTGHAVMLACSAQVPRDINVPGRRLGGIHFAMDYVAQQNRRTAGGCDLHASVITAHNKEVVVIGGGDTGSVRMPLTCG